MLIKSLQDTVQIEEAYKAAAHTLPYQQAHFKHFVCSIKKHHKFKLSHNHSKKRK